MKAASPRHTFRKAERLASRKAIEELIEQGKSIQVAPFRLTYAFMPLPENSPAQIAFAAPKRYFKKAVDRNRLKRLMREVFRKNKSEIYPLLVDQQRQVALLLSYSGKTIANYNETEEKVVQILKRLAKIIQSPTQ